MLWFYLVDWSKKLKKLIDEIDMLINYHHGTPELTIWHNAVIRTLHGIFGINDVRITQFRNISFTVGIITDSTPDSDFQDAYVSGLKQSELLLKDFLKEIPESACENNAELSHTLRTDIFIVHGHDNEAKQETARFIEKLNLNAVILHERLNKGQTIIEKLFRESQSAGYALILLTPDDVGFVKGNEIEFEERARQNVVLELGYFLGKLGRERVCVLLKGNTNIPNDFNGVLYIPMDDAGKWKYDLAKEMREIGFKIDLNTI